MNAKATVPDLKELFSQAAEIAKNVPESMQEAAFNRAVDLLTQGIPPSERKDTRNQGERSRKTKKKTTEDFSAAHDNLTVLLSSIDSTQHPGVVAASKVLDRALMVLQIALNDHGVDGLTPAQIAEILTGKFRVSTTKDAVKKALGRATSFVNRIPHGKGYLYKIMGPDEAYLVGGTQPVTKNPSVKIQRKRRIRRNKGSEREEKTSESQIENSLERDSAKNKRTSGRLSKTGPKAAVKALIDSGYFSSPHTGPDIHDFLNKKRGLNFGIDQIRLVLLRLVRDGELERDENDAGNYEYKAPTA
jgi:hypothetical protein